MLCWIWSLGLSPNLILSTILCVYPYYFWRQVAHKTQWECMFSSYNQTMPASSIIVDVFTVGRIPENRAMNKKHQDLNITNAGEDKYNASLKFNSGCKY